MSLSAVDAAQEGLWRSDLKEAGVDIPGEGGPLLAWMAGVWYLVFDVNNLNDVMVC